MPLMSYEIVLESNFWTKYIESDKWALLGNSGDSVMHTFWLTLWKLTMRSSELGVGSQRRAQRLPGMSWSLSLVYQKCCSLEDSGHSLVGVWSLSSCGRVTHMKLWVCWGASRTIFPSGVRDPATQGLPGLFGSSDSCPCSLGTWSWHFLFL